MTNSNKYCKFRQVRVRNEIRKRNKADRPRLCVFLSNKHIYVQLIDDKDGCTIVSSSTLCKTLQKELTEKTYNISAAAQVGKDIAKKAINLGIKDVVFDKGAYKYHGKAKALADSARAEGLNF